MILMNMNLNSLMWLAATALVEIQSGYRKAAGDHSNCFITRGLRDKAPWRTYLVQGGAGDLLDHRPHLGGGDRVLSWACSWSCSCPASPVLTGWRTQIPSAPVSAPGEGSVGGGSQPCLLSPAGGPLRKDPHCSLLWENSG